MNRYKQIKKLGDGAYGSVIKAVNRSTGEVVCYIVSSAFNYRTGCHQTDEEKVSQLGGMHEFT